MVFAVGDPDRALFFGTINAMQSDLNGLLISQHGDGIALENADDLADKSFGGGNSGEKKQRQKDDPHPTTFPNRSISCKTAQVTTAQKPVVHRRVASALLF